MCLLFLAASVHENPFVLPTSSGSPFLSSLPVPQALPALLSIESPPSSLLFLWRGKLESRVNAADAELRVRSYERCDQWCLSSKNTIDQGIVGKD